MAGRLILTLLSTFLALGVGELILRQLGPAQLGFRYVDGGFQNPVEFDTEVQRNRRGYHDVDHGPKGAGITRLLLLGDSFVAAESVTVPETVGQRLQQHLREASPRAWEVLSWGKPGWGQRPQLTQLRRQGRKARPDVVLTLFFPGNDVAENSDELTARDRARNLYLAQAMRPKLLVLPQSALNRLVSHRITMRLAYRNPEAVPARLFVYASGQDAAWDEAWARTERLFLQTRDVAQTLGAVYALVSASDPKALLPPREAARELLQRYPGLQGTGWDLDRVDRRLAGLCEVHAIPFLALTPRFREATLEGRTLHWKYDGHWNVDGNDLAGRLIADFVLRQGWPAPAR